MKDDPTLAELWRIKEEISTQFASARQVTAVVNKFAKTSPLPPAGKARKMIEGFPRDQSVADEDEIMMELQAVKEAIADEYAHDVPHHRAETSPKSRKLLDARTFNAAKKTPKAASFRSTQRKLAKLRSLRNT